MDLINNTSTPATREVAKFQKNYDIDKYYKVENMGSYKNNILYNFEDWQGANLKPNSTYRYKLSLYDYHNVKVLEKANLISPEPTEPFELTTLPLSIRSGDIISEFVPDEYEAGKLKKGNISISDFPMVPQVVYITKHKNIILFMHIFLEKTIIGLEM